jgi:coproporphyrinogen III oxidase-like Fe-S oxidoreductase
MYKELFPVTYYFYPLLEGGYAPGAHQAGIEVALTAERTPEPESLLYVHVPYCHDVCQFCPFHIKVTNQTELYARYTRQLCDEIRLLSRYPSVAGRRFRAVYFGGGSPSILGAALVSQILTAISELLRLTDDVEISFEGEPRTLGDLDLLAVLKAHRVSRISFGLQTYDEEHRKRFRIQATLADVDRVTDHARKVGFDDINVDMMYDLPGQTVTELHRDLAALERAGYDSIDYYNLHYYAFPKTFKQAIERGEVPAKPSAEAHLAMAHEIRWRLAELGYRGVADQVFSRTGKLCEYFRLLWGGGDGDHQAETIAVGSSARGYVNGISYMNTGDLAAYASLVESGQLPVAKLSRRLDHPENRGAVFMPKFFRIAKRFGGAIASIRPEILAGWLASGLLRETQDAYEITEHGRLWTTNMMHDALEAGETSLAEQAVVALGKRPGVRTGTF